jgi:NADPH-dependent 2,4-dienoyl-CoA reductase/sulfur reductase-like enzyme
MLIPFWFQTDKGLGYGVTAATQELAEQLLADFGYPVKGVRIVDVVIGISADALDQNHVIPNAGPLKIKGVWFPRHNV